MSDPLKWGILGTGVIANKFAADLQATERGVLTATGSRTKESAAKFAKEHGGDACGSYDDLLAQKEVEAIYISLPNGLHREWTIKALRAGKHVLCEKPIARNADEAEQMFRVAEETGLTLIEAFMYRLRPVVKKLLSTINAGEIGQPKLIRSNFTFNRPVEETDARYHPDHGGGSLMDVGAYCVNLCRAIAGSEPIDVSAVAHIHELGVDDYAAGLLKFGDSLLATFTCGMTVESDRKTYIAGTRGSIMIDTPWFLADSFEITRKGETRVIEVAQEKPLYTLEAEAFAEVVQDDVTPWTTKDDTLGNMRTLDRLREKIGLPIKFDD